MTILEVTKPTIIQKESIYMLWNKEYPEKLGFQNISDLDNYLETLSGLDYFLLLNDLNEIEGWAIKFFRENEKWFAIMIDSKVQKQGKGALLLDRLKQDEEVLNGWVIDHNNDTKKDGEKYQSPLFFYQKNGFSISPENRLETSTLSAVKITWKRK